MQVPGGEALEAERVQQRRVAPDHDLGDLPADGDHLVAVIRVGYHVDVRRHVVEDWEVVGGERAGAARADLPVERPAPGEASQAVREPGAPLVRKTGSGGGGGGGGAAGG